MDAKNSLYGKLCNVTKVKDRKRLLKVLNKYHIDFKSNSKDYKSVANEFIASKKIEGLKSNVINSYSKVLIDDFGKMFGYKKIGTYTKDDILKWISKKELKSTKRSIYNKLSYIRTFFNYCEDNNYITYNPIKSIKYKCTKVQRHYIHEEDVLKLKKACKNNFEKALIEFLLSSGCRVNEVVNIKLKDVNFNDCTCIVTGKGDKTRMVIFSKTAKRYILKHMEECTDNEYLFCRRLYKLNGNHKSKKFLDKNGPLRNIDISHTIKEIASRTDIKYSIHPHLFRHTFASECLQKGMDLVSIQKLLGHSDISTTQIYAETNLECIKNEYKKIYK